MNETKRQHLENCYYSGICDYFKYPDATKNFFNRRIPIWMNNSEKYIYCAGIISADSVSLDPKLKGSLISTGGYIT